MTTVYTDPDGYYHIDTKKVDKMLPWWWGISVLIGVVTQVFITVSWVGGTFLPPKFITFDPLIFFITWATVCMVTPSFFIMIPTWFEGCGTEIVAYRNDGFYYGWVPISDTSYKFSGNTTRDARKVSERIEEMKRSIAFDKEEKLMEARSEAIRHCEENAAKKMCCKTYQEVIKRATTSTEDACEECE